jgi:hypothetical protein
MYATFGVVRLVGAGAGVAMILVRSGEGVSALSSQISHLYGMSSLILIRTDLFSHPSFPDAPFL